MFSKKICFFEWKSSQNPDWNSPGVYETLFEVNPYDLYAQLLYTKVFFFFNNLERFFFKLKTVFLGLAVKESLSATPSFILLAPWEFLDNSAAVCSTDKILIGKVEK